MVVQYCKLHGTNNNGRSGYEQFPDGNRLYVMAQFFQEWLFIMMLKDGKTCSFGEEEFRFSFGDYDVNITVPADHVMEATGVTKQKQVLHQNKLKRWELAEKHLTNQLLLLHKKKQLQRRQVFQIKENMEIQSAKCS